MRNKNAKKHAKGFVNQVNGLSWEELCGYLSRAGWSVIRFDEAQEKEFYGRLNLENYGQDSFCYQVKGQHKRARMVCIRAELCEATAAALLLHETGHILLQHDLDSLTPEDENEANEFVRYAQEYNRKRNRPRNNSSALAIVAACSVVIGGIAIRWMPPAQPVSGSSIASSVQDTNTENQEPISGAVVVTKTGDRYHLPSCQYVQGKDSLRPMSIAEAQAAGYIPCKVCRPDAE